MILRLHHVAEFISTERVTQNDTASENSVGSSDALLLDGLSLSV